MHQTTLTAFYHSRKRPAPDDTVSSKSKIRHLENIEEKAYSNRVTPILNSNSLNLQNELHQSTVITINKNAETSKTVHEVKQPLHQENLEEKALTKKSCNVSNITKDEATTSARKDEATTSARKDEATTSARKDEATTSARKELSLGDIRKKLKNSSRLAELKATAERLSKGIQQLKETTETRNLKEFKSIDVEVPISPRKKSLIQNELLSPKKKVSTESKRPLISPRKVIVSPIKSPTKISAYVRQSLLPINSSLQLPHHYRFLTELFRGMETVVSLLYNRNEKITFTKLKPSIQEMLKRNFTEHHLAQIKKIVPDFYNFEILKVKNFSNTNQKQEYELVISPNFPSAIKTMNPTVLLERRRYFHETLINLVKKHHTNYLLSLDPPMVIPEDKLTRWHPEFDIEKIPDIECAKLPEIPDQGKFSTAQDVLSKARDLFKCNTKMERALENLAKAKERGLTEEEKQAIGINGQISTSTTSTQTPLATTTGMTFLNPALRNLPAPLLEKVRAKQAARALEAMTRSSENEQKYIIYSRLPELARTLRNIFVTERKNVLALNIILSKLGSSFKASVSANDYHKDIKALTEEAPDWIKLHVIRNNTYIKLDRNADLKKIICNLEALAEKYKNHS